MDASTISTFHKVSEKDTKMEPKWMPFGIQIRPKTPKRRFKRRFEKESKNESENEAQMEAN